MSTFKKIEKYEKIKKTVILLTIGLVILDTIAFFANPAYLPSFTSLIGLGFSCYSLANEYTNYRVKNKEMSKMILLLSIILGGFSLYHIILNIINMSGALP